MNMLQDILNQDLDPGETREWTEALSAVINADGPERAHYLLERMVDTTRRAGGHLPFGYVRNLAADVSDLLEEVFGEIMEMQKAP